MYDLYLILLYMGIILIIGGFLLFGLIGRAIALSIFDLFFPPKKEDKYTFIDNSVHNHYHEHKNLTIIDDETRENILNNKKPMFKDTLIFQISRICFD